MSPPNVPPPPDTNPRGGAHGHVDTHSLAERAADKADDATMIARHADDRAMASYALSSKHAEIIETIPAIHAKLDLVVRPLLTPPAMRWAAYAAAAAMLVSACALVALVVLMSRPAVASAATQSGAVTLNRVP